MGNKIQPQPYQLISSIEFLFIDISVNKVGRNDKLLTFTTSNARINLGLHSQIVLSFDKITYTVTFLVVQLKLHASNSGGEIFISGKGTKIPHACHLMWQKEKKKKKTIYTESTKKKKIKHLPDQASKYKGQKPGCVSMVTQSLKFRLEKMKR